MLLILICFSVQVASLHSQPLPSSVSDYKNHPLYVLITSQPTLTCPPGRNISSLCSVWLVFHCFNESTLSQLISNYMHHVNSVGLFGNALYIIDNSGIFKAQVSVCTFVLLVSQL